MPGSRIDEIMEQNDAVVRRYSLYLNETPRFLNEEMVRSLAAECQVDEEEAFRALFFAALDPDDAETPAGKEREHLYFRPGLRCLDPAPYRSDEYYRTIRFPERKTGQWELKTSLYAPYEPFVRSDPVVTPEFREIPQIGYFREEFRFPAVLENGIEWMTVTPNEIETMKEPIRRASGDVLTLGLGLGYFAFHASQKDTVTSVTVVEKDPDVIRLFSEELLPQFPNRQKINIVKADAFRYLKETLPEKKFSYLFADLWHDPSDGLELYLRLKKEIPENLPTDYWIEVSLLSLLRQIVFRKLRRSGLPGHVNIRPEQYLSDAFLKTLNPELN